MTIVRITSNPCGFCVADVALNDALAFNTRILMPHDSDHNKVVLNSDEGLTIKVGSEWFYIDADVNISTAIDMDTGAISNGKQYHTYACDNNGQLVFKHSLNATYPTGFTANNSREIGGFHTLCANVGTIAGHTLTGYLANDILPASIWDLRHRAINGNNEGLVYDAGIQKWVMIYLASGTGTNTTSAYLGTISDVRNWMDFVDDGHAIGMRLPTDHEFQSFAAGSNEETNILGSADPGTTGGHSDTATPARRLISKIGCEECAGVMNQWLLDQSWRLDGADLSACKVWAWEDLPGAKGSLYKEGTLGDVKLLAGGSWPTGTSCGSRGRYAYSYRWNANANLGARFLAEPLLGV